MQLAGVYSRRPSGTEDILTFSASGWTYDRTFVLYDYETESMWYHLEGIQGMECISGHYEGHVVEELRGVLTRWPEWQGNHPKTKFMCYGDHCAKIK